MGMKVPGGALDQILVRDVPSKLQTHIRSLYQLFEGVLDFIPIFRKRVFDFIFHTKIWKVGTVPYTKILRIDTVLHSNIWKIDALPDGTAPYSM